MEQNLSKNNIVHNLFEVTIIAKGISGCFEIVIGILFFFFKTETIYRGIIAVAGYRVVRDWDAATDYLIRQANGFSLNTQYFIVFYFLFYGAVNIWLVASLLRGKVSVYPAAIVFFLLFTVYQLYRFLMYRSGLLLFFIFFDIFLIFLTWLEYKRLKNKNSGPGNLLKMQQ